MMQNKITLISTIENDRLDKIIISLLKETKNDFSRSMIQKLILEENVLVNGVIETNQKYQVKLNDEIILNIPEVKPSTIEKQEIAFDIVFEDNDIIIINKPNNLLVHPGAGNESRTLVNGLLFSIKDLSSIGGVERPGIVHRLDKQTTGLLIVAKNDLAHRKMSEMIANREVYKEYIALVWGVIDENKGIIDAPIGRHPNDRKKMTVTNKNSKYAKTNFEVIEKFENASLIRCSIETGRTHQIRVHFQFIKHPIMNDPAYGRLTEKITDFGQYLHAHKLRFNHPITNEEISFETELPKEFNDKIKELRGK